MAGCASNGTETRTSYILAGNQGPNRAQFENALETGGTWLGCANDFWVALAMLVACKLFCVVSVYLGVELATRRGAKDATFDCRTMSCVPPKPEFRHKFLHRAIAGAYAGHRFVINAELAVRAAVVFACCGSTYWVDALYSINEQGFNMQYIAAMLAFMLWKDSGNTLSLIWTGGCGTALSVLHSFFMFRLYPHGTADAGMYSGAWWFGVFDLIIFTTLVLGLRFDTNLQMFSLSWQAYFSMCFLNPGNDEVFSTGLQNFSLTSPSVKALTGCLIGSLLAVLCTLFPTCISCLNKAQDVVLPMTWEMGCLWERMLMHYADSHAPERARSFAVELTEFRKQRETLDQLLRTAWWECFDLGRTGRVRRGLMRLNLKLRRLSDWLEGALSSVKAADRGFASDKELLRVLHPHMQELVYKSWALLCHCSHLACVGKSCLDPLHSEALRQELSALAAIQAALSEALRHSGSQKQEELHEGNLAEHAFAFALSSYADGVVAHASEILGEDSHAPPYCSRFRIAFAGVLPGLSRLSSASLFEILRHLLGFLLAFFVGWFGIGEKGAWALNPYSSTVASTIAFLIFSGGKQASALQKTMNRFMGVGVGTFLGQLMYYTGCMGTGMFGETVTTFVIVPGFVALTFVIEAVALFFAFSSQSSGYQGLLVGCFFAQHFMRPCSQDNLAAQLRSGYENLLAQFVAMFIATLMELFVHQPSDSIAVRQLAGFGESFVGTLRQLLLSPEESNIKFHRFEGRKRLDAAAEACSEAGKEFRGWKLPWRDALARNGLAVYSELWVLASIMEYVAHEPGEAFDIDCGKTRQELQGVLACAPMTQMAQSLLDRAQNSMKLFEALLSHQKESDALAVPLGGAQELLRNRQEQLKNLPAILKEINARLGAQDYKVRSLLVTDDLRSQAATLLINLLHAALQLASLESCLAEEPEIVWKVEEPRAPARKLYVVPSDRTDPANFFTSLETTAADAGAWCAPDSPYTAASRPREDDVRCTCIKLLA